jgi:hypothetical protein
MCRQHIQQVVHIDLSRAEYNGFKIARVQESDPEILSGLCAANAAATDS